ncbi:MAG: hypothetical protein H7319_20625 [Spirosoma sp.]|nr:hypothetical protein [Spirosoma sp.]
MKRTKKDRAQLAGILRELKQAQTFLRASTVVVCTTQLPNACSYYDKTGCNSQRSS